MLNAYIVKILMEMVMEYAQIAVLLPAVLMMVMIAAIQIPEHTLEKALIIVQKIIAVVGIGTVMELLAKVIAPSGQTNTVITHVITVIPPAPINPAVTTGANTTQALL